MYDYKWHAFHLQYAIYTQNLYLCRITKNNDCCMAAGTQKSPSSSTSVCGGGIQGATSGTNANRRYNHAPHKDHHSARIVKNRTGAWIAHGEKLALGGNLTER